MYLINDDLIKYGILHLFVYQNIHQQEYKSKLNDKRNDNNDTHMK